MSFQSTKLYSVVSQTCPRCHQGPLFVNKNPYKLENWDKMHADCPVCKLHFEREPGFFQGSMYVSYALGVALSVAVVLLNWMVGFNPIAYFISNTLALIVLAPLLFRWSRALYLNIFISYDKKSIA
jgi:hypothetical protein